MGRLYLLVSPVRFLEKENREHQFESPVDIFDGPAEGYVYPAYHDNPIDGQGIEDDGNHLDEEGHAGVARARYGLEQQIARYRQQVERRHDVDRTRAVGYE